MLKNKMYSDILADVKTSSDREQLLAEIELMKQAMFEPKKGVDGVLKSDVRASVASIFRAKIDGGEDFEKYLAGLAKILIGLNEVKVEVASEPSEGSLELIYSWLAKSIGSQVVVTLTINPSLLGGAVISFNGKYYDGSLKRVVEETLAENREALIKMIYSSG